MSIFHPDVKILEKEQKNKNMELDGFLQYINYI